MNTTTSTKSKHTGTIQRTSYLLLSFMLVFTGCGRDGDNPVGPDNQAPSKAELTTPANDANEVDLTDIELTWLQAIDPDGDPVRYEVYLDSNNPPTTAVASDLNTTSYTLEDTLDSSTPYYWMVTASDGNSGETESDVSSFTTRDQTFEEKLVGLWVGEYGTGTNPPSAGYAFLFRNDGTVRVFNSADTTAADKAEGTYSGSGNMVNTNYTYIEFGDTYSTEATINFSFDNMEGTWGNGSSTTDGGTFYLDKQ